MIDRDILETIKIVFADIVVIIYSAIFINFFGKEERNMVQGSNESAKKTKRKEETKEET